MTRDLRALQHGVLYVPDTLGGLSRYRRAGEQIDAVPNGGWGTIIWNTVDYDDAPVTLNQTNGEITIDASGLYVVTFGCYMENAAMTADRFLWHLWKNGGFVNGVRHRQLNSGYHSRYYTHCDEFVAGDVVELRCYVDGAGGMDLGAADGNWSVATIKRVA